MCYVWTRLVQGLQESKKQEIILHGSIITGFTQEVSPALQGRYDFSMQTQTMNSVTFLTGGDSHFLVEPGPVCFTAVLWIPAHLSLCVLRQSNQERKKTKQEDYQPEQK